MKNQNIKFVLLLVSLFSLKCTKHSICHFYIVNSAGAGETFEVQLFLDDSLIQKVFVDKNSPCSKNSNLKRIDVQLPDDKVVFKAFCPKYNLLVQDTLKNNSNQHLLLNFTHAHPFWDCPKNHRTEYDSLKYLNEPPEMRISISDEPFTQI